MPSSLVISYRNPKNHDELEIRNQLLQSALRDQPNQWPYAAEYPIVLSSESLSTSWCAFLDTELVGHANLWPRTLIHSSQQHRIPIGLIGNVATDKQHRGQGHMRSLISNLEQIAQSQGLQALILWSDLLQFYQNFGFSSIGREWRLTICQRKKIKPTGISLQQGRTLSDGDLLHMLSLRPKLEWDLQRSLDEFRKLLEIPNTLLFVRRCGLRITSWMVIGRGADLQSVIHEWGAQSAEELVSDIQTILMEFNALELILLAPGCLPESWLALLKQQSKHIASHPMALAKATDSSGSNVLNNLARSFIWGLDSI